MLRINLTKKSELWKIDKPTTYQIVALVLLFEET